MDAKTKTHLDRVNAVCNLQSIHDGIEKSDDVLSDSDNPFIDNGRPLSDRFSSWEEEIRYKTSYLKGIMIESGVLE